MNRKERYRQNLAPVLIRFEGNPIIEPLPQCSWQSKATFNPAAIVLNDQVHLLYRAVGDNDSSTLGYARSRDGLHNFERLEKPAYVPRETFEGTDRSYSGELTTADEYVSGGGAYGGCEDPRMTQIGDDIYLTYVAYDGHSPPRVALSTIKAGDFLLKRWAWKKPVLISEPGVVNKNACLFPERIKGKYVIFHRVFPDILVDYQDDLDFDGETRWLGVTESIRPRSTHWDSRKVGAGAPPIKTDYGWLFIYQAVNDTDPLYHYKIGAMLLDTENPARVLARCTYPVLEPRASYEFDGWKAGVVYPCGAVVFGEKLYVYYGAADKYTCVAVAPLRPFMERLRQHKERNPKEHDVED
jgi:beta-1,2-mannobiose phosphorylase / 1,2-beta-oligomannan phosphorylase